MKSYCQSAVLVTWRLPGVETTEVEAHILLVRYRSSTAGCPQAVQNSAHDFSVKLSLCHTDSSYPGCWLSLVRFFYQHIYLRVTNPALYNDISVPLAQACPTMIYLHTSKSLSTQLADFPPGLKTWKVILLHS